MGEYQIYFFEKQKKIKNILSPNFQLTLYFIIILDASQLKMKEAHIFHFSRHNADVHHAIFDVSRVLPDPSIRIFVWGLKNDDVVHADRKFAQFLNDSKQTRPVNPISFVELTNGTQQHLGIDDLNFWSVLQQKWTLIFHERHVNKRMDSDETILIVNDLCHIEASKNTKAADMIRKSLMMKPKSQSKQDCIQIFPVRAKIDETETEAMLETAEDQDCRQSIKNTLFSHRLQTNDGVNVSAHALFMSWSLWKVDVFSFFLNLVMKVATSKPIETHWKCLETIVCGSEDAIGESDDGKDEPPQKRRLFSNATSIVKFSMVILFQACHWITHYTQSISLIGNAKCGLLIETRRDSLNSDVAEIHRHISSCQEIRNRKNQLINSAERFHLYQPNCLVCQPMLINGIKNGISHFEDELGRILYRDQAIVRTINPWTMALPFKPQMQVGNFDVYAFCIHMPNKIDRRETWQVRNPSLPGCFMFDAFDGKGTDYSWQDISIVACNQYAFNKGAMGCTLSHVYLWTLLTKVYDHQVKIFNSNADQVKQQNISPPREPLFLILEDDCSSHPRAWKLLERDLTKMSDAHINWNMLYCGYHAKRMCPSYVNIPRSTSDITKTNLSELQRLMEYEKDNWDRKPDYTELDQSDDTFWNPIFDSSQYTDMSWGGTFSYIIRPGAAQSMLMRMQVLGGVRSCVDNFMTSQMGDDHLENPHLPLAATHSKVVTPRIQTHVMVPMTFRSPMYYANSDRKDNIDTDIQKDGYSASNIAQGTVFFLDQGLTRMIELWTHVMNSMMKRYVHMNWLMSSNASMEWILLHKSLSTETFDAKVTVESHVIVGNDSQFLKRRFESVETQQFPVTRGQDWNPMNQIFVFEMSDSINSSMEWHHLFAFANFFVVQNVSTSQQSVWRTEESLPFHLLNWCTSFHSCHILPVSSSMRIVCYLTKSVLFDALTDFLTVHFSPDVHSVHRDFATPSLPSMEQIFRHLSSFSM